MKRVLLCAVTLLLLASGTTFAQSYGWVSPNPASQRHLSFGDIPELVTSYGSLVPCESTVPAAVALKNAGATYVRLWHSWSGCGDNPDWLVSPWRSPWALVCDPATDPGRCCDPAVGQSSCGKPKWDLGTLDEGPGSYWQMLRDAVDAARNTNDGTGKRLAVEVHLFSKQEFGRPFSPFRKDGNPLHVDMGQKEFQKVPYNCTTAGVDCPVFEIQQAYVRRLIDTTQAYGNVIYEVTNEPEVDCENPTCVEAMAFWGNFWPTFIKDYLAGTYGRDRVVSNSAGNGALEHPDVHVANIHFEEDYDAPFLNTVLPGYAAAARDTFLNHQKVVNIDEFANAERDPARLRKKAWTIIASGGNFHIEDPCHPGVLDCAGAPGADAKPWVPVRSINAFEQASGWQFYRGKPIVGVDGSSWFYWMIQGDPAFDSIGYSGAGRQDHVGYLAFRPDQVCSTEPLQAYLPAVPDGATEYVARLWSSTGQAADSYLRNGQGAVLEYRFGWSGGDFDWCGAPAEFRNAFLGGDVVFHVRADGVSPVVLTVAKEGPGGGTVASVPAGISCGAVCTAAYAPQTLVQLQAVPDGGSVFAGWAGACAGQTNPCTVEMTASASATAAFSLLPKYLLTVDKVGSGAGFVGSNPAGVSCGADCSEEFLDGQQVTLTALPDAGSVFSGWSGACSGTGACVVTMTVARSVTAAFAPRPTRTLTVTKAGSGVGRIISSPAGIDCGPACSGAFPAGSSVVLSALASPGSVFVGWTGAGCQGTGACTVALGADTTVTAAFTPGNNPPTATVTCSPSSCHPRPGAPCTVACSVSAEDPDRNPLTFQWSGGCTPGTATTAACSVAGLTPVTVSVAVNDGTVAPVFSTTVSGRNSAPTCVINGGAALDVWHLSWTGYIPVSISDADGDPVAGVSNIWSTRSQQIGIGAYQDTTSSPPNIRFRPSCINAPQDAFVGAAVSDGWTSSNCFVEMHCLP